MIFAEWMKFYCARAVSRENFWLYSINLVKDWVEKVIIKAAD